MSQLCLWDQPVQPAPTSAKTETPPSLNNDALLRAGEWTNNRALRCITAAELMQKQIEAKHRSANNLLVQPPTRKRLDDADTLRREAMRLERIQATLRKLATMHENGTVLAELAAFTSRSAIENALFTSSGQSSIHALRLLAREDRLPDQLPIDNFAGLSPFCFH
jgi:hypothetical protein